LERVYQEFLGPKPGVLADFEAAFLPRAPKDRSPVPDEVAQGYEIEDRDVAGSVHCSGT
jgi:hypothetical protein